MEVLSFFMEIFALTILNSFWFTLGHTYGIVSAADITTKISFKEEIITLLVTLCFTNINLLPETLRSTNSIFNLHTARVTNLINLMLLGKFIHVNEKFFFKSFDFCIFLFFQSYLLFSELSLFLHYSSSNLVFKKNWIPGPWELISLKRVCSWCRNNLSRSWWKSL